MLQIPPELQARYNALLVKKAILDKYQIFTMPACRKPPPLVVDEGKQL